MKRGIFFILLAVAMIIAFVCSLAPEPMKTAVTQAPADAPKKNGTIHAIDSPASTTSSTTRAPPIEIARQPACMENADCGITYLASCHCDGDTLAATQYIPLCVDGECIWKSKTEEMFCRGREYESGDNSTGQRCVNGFGRCIKNSEYERYLVQRENVSAIGGTDPEGFSDEYNGYRFRYNGSGYHSGSSYCYENQYFLIDYSNKYGRTGQVAVSWNSSAFLGNIVLKAGQISRDENGTDRIVLWARKAKKNDTGYF